MSTAATAGREEHAGLDGGPRIDRVRAYDLELPYPNPLRPAWRPGLVSHGRRFTFVAVDADGLTGYAGADGHQYRLWGFQRDAVPAYASTCEVGTPEERAALAGHYRALGYRAMKLRFHATRSKGTSRCSTPCATRNRTSS